MNGRRFSRLKSCLCIFNAPACSPDAPCACCFPLAPFLQSLDNHGSVMPLINAQKCQDSRDVRQRPLEVIENNFVTMFNVVTV
jgi:hypothetical protein